VIPDPYAGPKAATFTALDALPESLRRAVMFSAFVWETPDVLDQFRRAARAKSREWATDWMIASIAAADTQAVRERAAQYRSRYGRPYPHVAADATILGYLPPRGGRRYRLAGGSARVRAAWAASERLMAG